MEHMWLSFNRKGGEGTGKSRFDILKETQAALKH